MAAKLPDLSELSMDELTELVASANTRIGELRQAKIDELKAKRAELDAELAKLSGTPSKPRLPAALSGGDENQRVKPGITHRGPNGETYKNRGPVPKWAKKLGATTKADMEKWRVTE